MDTGKIIAALGRALTKLRGNDSTNPIIPKLEEALDNSISAFPRLRPVAKYPVFRTPALDSDSTLELALDFLGRVIIPLMNSDSVAAGTTLREMNEDRELMMQTPVAGVEFFIEGKSTGALEISNLEIRIATPLLQRMYESAGQNWENVARLVGVNLETALQRAQERAQLFETSLDDVRAYLFSIDGDNWLPHPVFPSGMSVYVHWLGSMFYIALGESRSDFDEWMRYGRIGVATDELFSRGFRQGET